jgi:hypothetical protein
MSLQSRVAVFLEAPKPSSLIILPGSATEGFMSEFARFGRLKAGQDRTLLLDACIASYLSSARETENEEERSYFSTSARFLADIKAESNFT